MAYVIENEELGSQPISTTSATAVHPIGKVVRAYDPVYGSGEFIYLKGVASTIVGSVVTYGGNDGSGNPTFQSALAPSTAGLAQPLAVAMSANVGGQYGWYQIRGAAVAATNGTLTAGAAVYLAGSGQLTSTQANGKQVVGAVSATATGTPATAQAVVYISNPVAQGQIV